MTSSMLARFLSTAILVAGISGVQASALDDLGFTSLWAAHPELTGTGLTVAQVEASGDGNAYKVNPAAVGVAESRFYYYDTNHPYTAGTTGTTFSASGGESGHANLVGDHFFGATNGGAPGVSAIENFDASYFFNSIVARNNIFGWQPVAINSAIVNQSFVFTTTDPTTVATVNRLYDGYAIRYGTLFINGTNAIDGTTNAPASSYNGISVGITEGGYSGRAQLIAPGGATSFATPYVSAAATVLRQAALAGQFNALSGTNAADSRVLKVALLNGATKTATWTHTSTDPLDATSGAGIVNVKSSYDNLAGGQRAKSTSNQTTLGTISTSTTFTSPIGSQVGWDLTSLSASLTRDAVAHYFFDLSSQTNLTLTATLTWNSIVNTATILTSSGTNLINNFDLVLIDTLTNTIVWSSTSTNQNVEHIYLTGLAGSKYDLQVILRGGSGTPALTDTYAVAWNWSPGNTTAVPESHFAWLIGAVALAAIAGRRFARHRTVA